MSIKLFLNKQEGCLSVKCVKSKAEHMQYLKTTYVSAALKYTQCKTFQHHLMIKLQTMYSIQEPVSTTDNELTSSKSFNKPHTNVSNCRMKAYFPSRKSGFYIMNFL